MVGSIFYQKSEQDYNITIYHYKHNTSLLKVIIMEDVIILGGNHHNTLGVVRALGQAGLSRNIKLIMVNDKPDFVSKSKYIKRPNYRRVADESGIAQALDNLKYNNGKPVIICCGDSLSSYVDRHYDELSRRFTLPNAKNEQGEITRLMSKEVQMKYAELLGIDVPKSLTFSKERHRVKKTNEEETGDVL